MEGEKKEIEWEREKEGDVHAVGWEGSWFGDLGR